MSFSLRPALPLAGLVLLNLTLCESLGIYSRTNCLLVMIAYGLGLWGTLARDRVLRFGNGRFNGNGLLLGAFALLLVGWAVPYATVSFPDVDWAVLALPPVALVGFLLTVLIVALGWHELIADMSPRFRAAVPWMLAGVLLVSFVLHSLVIYASPEPIVDVYNLLHDSADYILVGQNPYAHDYHSPYHTERAKENYLYFPDHPLRVPGYPPLAYLISTAPRFFKADVRWADVVADAVAGLCLFLVGRRRGRPFAGLVVAATYLFLPKTTFVIERSWTEPLVNAFLGLGFVLTERTGAARVVGHICFGLGLTAKQYGVPMFVPYVWAFRSSWRLVLAGLAVGVAIMLPWLFWSPRDFLDIVVVKHLTKAPGFHSCTLISASADLLGSYPKPAAMWLVCGPLLLLIAYRTPPAGPAAALAMGTALMTYVVFSPVGFMNYFLPVQYLWLMGSLALAFPDDAVHTLTSR
jgi:hypothetical protein